MSAERPAQFGEVPLQLIVAAFHDERGADHALAELKRARSERLIGIINAAVIRRDARDHLHIKETADMGGGKGAAIGGAVGAAIGLLAGPATVVTGALGAVVGGAIGGLAAKLRDSGFADDRLRSLGEALKPGQSAIVALIEHRWVAEVEAMMAEAGAQVLVETLKADIASELEEGRDVAFSAISTSEGVATARVSTASAKGSEAGEGAGGGASAEPAGSTGNMKE